MVQAAFLDADRDVGVLPGPVGMNQRQAELASSDVHDIDRLTRDAGRKISLGSGRTGRSAARLRPAWWSRRFWLKRFSAHSRIRDADGAQVPHGPPHQQVAEFLVAFEVDLADLDLRSLIHFEHDVQGRRRKGLQLRRDGGELPAALRQVVLQDDLGALDLVPVVGRFRRQSDAALFEAVQHFGRGDRFQPVVLDGAHHRPLLDDERDDPAGLARLPGPFDIVEAAAVP